MTRHADLPQSIQRCWKLWHISGRCIAATAVLLLAGCASSIQGGVGPLASPKAAQLVDLVDEMFTRAQRLDGNLREASECGFNKGGNRSLELPNPTGQETYSFESRLWKSSNIPGDATKETRCMNKAHSALEEALKNNPTTAQAERNSLQDRLIVASDQSCGLYKRYLNSQQSSSNFLLGSSSLVLAAVATNITDAVAAKNYTTGALISSGLAAQYNTDMFNSQMVYAIGKAIDASRQDALTKLRQERMDKSMVDYGLSAAIGDALRYHELCSLMGGLAHMDKSVLVMSDPGLKHIASWFPSGTFTVKNGVISASNVQTADSSKGTPSSFSTISHNGSLPPLADFVFLEAEQAMKRALDNANNEISQTEVEESKKEAKKAAVVKPVTTDDACNLEKTLKGEDSPKQFCVPGDLLKKINPPICPSTEADGQSCAKKLAETLREKYNVWAIKVGANPNSIDTRKARTELDTAMQAHQSFVGDWLLPLQNAYVKNLRTWTDEKKQALTNK